VVLTITKKFKNGSLKILLLIELKHYANPEHLYCRFLDYGLTKENAVRWIRRYSRYFFETFFVNWYGKTRIKKGSKIGLKTLKNLLWLFF
tara:strand:+ start:1149 stop:1418 length:270 start_codon:yes stop_codon:yes gene_type:complete